MPMVPGDEYCHKLTIDQDERGPDCSKITDLSHIAGYEIKEDEEKKKKNSALQGLVCIICNLYVSTVRCPDVTDLFVKCQLRLHIDITEQ